MALLEIKNLHVALEDGTEIVKGVDLSVDLNQKHAIMGPNGSGKSTLAYALMGHPAYQVSEGEILLDGEDDPIPIPEFRTALLGAMEQLKVPRELASRYLNDGFSGGEKKRVEILQMAMLEPRIAVLDETDSGLDIDALRIVASGVNELVGPEMGAVVITHYQRILDYVEPDFVHVFVDGRIVAEGGPELAHRLEAGGYEAFAPAAVAGGEQ
jgi:Fe-S cluster assembly ATP-binding protein